MDVAAGFKGVRVPNYTKAGVVLSILTPPLTLARARENSAV
jgi:hypothetical protein